MKTAEASIVYLRDVLGIREVLLPIDSSPMTEVESSAVSGPALPFRLSIGAQSNAVLFIQDAQGAADANLFSGPKGEFFDRILQAMNLSRDRVSLMEWVHGVSDEAGASSVEALSELPSPSGWVIVFGERALEQWNRFSQENNLVTHQVIASPDLNALIEQPSLKKPLWVQLKRVMEDLGGRT